MLVRFLNIELNKPAAAAAVENVRKLHFSSLLQNSSI